MSDLWAGSGTLSYSSGARRVSAMPVTLPCEQRHTSSELPLSARGLARILTVPNALCNVCRSLSSVGEVGTWRTHLEQTCFHKAGFATNFWTRYFRVIATRTVISPGFRGVRLPARQLRPSLVPEGVPS